MISGLIRREQSISSHQILVVLHSLSVLLSAGVSLSRALEILAKEEPSMRLKRILEGLTRTVAEEGEPFSVACARYPRVFPQTVVVLMKIGESVGNLGERLADAGRMLERQERMAEDIKKALVTPCMTLISCFLMLYVIVAFVVPRMNQLYIDMHVEMPLLSKLVLNGVAWLCNPWFMAAVAVLGVLAAQQWQRIWPLLMTLGLRLRWTRRVIGQVLATSFCTSVGHLYKDGVALSVALDVLVEGTHIPVYSGVLRKVNDDFKIAGDLATALAAVPFFPPTVTSMMRIGQETGAVDQMLLTLASILDEDTQDLFNRVLTMLEPMLMVVFGSTLCVIFVGLFLPIYGLLSHLEI